MQLNLSQVTFTYPESAQPILSDITLSLSCGWTGVVGDNGSGKTTLAKLICGSLSPDAGVITHSLVCTLCAQDATTTPDQLFDFASAYDQEAIRLRSSLEIADDWPWHFDALSGGERKRVQIACALWSRPDVLVMDEPTNHVDETVRQAISHVLSSFDGIGLLISHDRYLLDQLCSKCLFIAHGQATLRQGSWSQASTQAELERKATRTMCENAQRERKRLEDEARRRCEEASRSASKRSARHVNPQDRDKIGKIKLAIYTGKDGIAGHLSSQMQSRLNKLNKQVDSTFVERRYEAKVWFDSNVSQRKTLMCLKASSIKMGDGHLLHTPALSIGNTEHIALMGDNGVGKTTLVHKIVSVLDADTRSCYVPQELDENQITTVMERLHGLGEKNLGFVLSAVAQLNSDPKRILDSGQPSPGEMRKIMLALGILDRPYIIIMDEPTNHLDLSSIEALQRMLSDFPGALLLVSHDTELLQAATSIQWEISRNTSGDATLCVHL